MQHSSLQARVPPQHSRGHHQQLDTLHSSHHTCELTLAGPWVVPQVPDALLPDDVAERLVEERQPHLVPVPGLEQLQQHAAAAAAAAGAPAAAAAAAAAAADPSQGVHQLRLSNGIKVNYRVTDNEPRSAMLRLVAMGGRAREGALRALPCTGCAALGCCCWDNDDDGGCFLVGSLKFCKDEVCAQPEGRACWPCRWNES
jgi:hypothetical protein